MSDDSFDIGPWPAATSEDGGNTLQDSKGSHHANKGKQQNYQENQQQDVDQCTSPQHIHTSPHTRPRSHPCHAHRTSGLSPAITQSAGSPYGRLLWKAPKARHTVEGIDPVFLNTQAWIQKPGIGVVYDWKSHHERNGQIVKLRRQKERQEQVDAAARKASESQQASQAIHQQWLKLKKQEHMMQKVMHVHRAWLHTLPTLERIPCEQRVAREGGWQSSTTTEAVAASLARAKVMHKPGKIAAL